jgi:hypothetical protein
MRSPRAASQAACYLLIASACLPSLPLTAQSVERAAVIPLESFAIRSGRALPAALFGNGELAIGTADQQIIVFDSTGRETLRWGRQGSGPGEFQLIQSLGVAGDTLFVLDATRRLSRFRRDVAPSTTAVLLPPHGAMPLTPRALAGGSIVLSQVMRPGDALAAAQGQLVVRASADGRVIETLGTLDVRDEMLRIPFPGGQREVQLPQPFVDLDRVAASPSGKWTAIVRAPSSRFRDGTHTGLLVEFRGPSGKSSRPIPSTPPPLTDATVRRWLDQRALDLGSAFPGGRTAARTAIATRLVRPTTHPTVRVALMGDDGTLWLLQSPADAPADLWTLATAAQGIIGTVTLPLGSRPLAVTRQAAWVVEEREDGEEQLVRYRVRAGR